MDSRKLARVARKNVERKAKRREFEQGFIDYISSYQTTLIKNGINRVASKEHSSNKKGLPHLSLTAFLVYIFNSVSV